MEAFIRRLKERKLVQWALGYAAAAFALVQALDIVSNRFHWPEPVMRWSILLLLFGFAVALVLAWYHGERGQQRVSRSELIVLGVLLTAAGAAAVAFGPRAAPAALPAAGGAGTLEPKTLAVLPFANLSGEPENAYFTDGIHEEVLTALSRIGDLHVISRTSMVQYRSTSKSLPQIARELGAGTVMEGSVRRARGRVHIEVRLVDAQTDRPIWVQAYDRDVADVFAVQREVALQIAVALQARITGREQDVIAGRPGTTVEAYDLYLRARERLAFPNAYNVQAAERQLERAVALDPEFAPGWGALARAYVLHLLNGEAYVLGMQGSEGADAVLAARARSAAETAIRLWPDEAEGHVALGWYHLWSAHDAAAALGAFEQAQRVQPSSADAWNGIAQARMVLGRWGGALAAGRNSVALDPRNGLNVIVLADIYEALGRYPDAIRTLEHLLTWAPDAGGLSPRIARYRFEENGDTAAYRWVLDSLPARDVTAAVRMDLHILQRNYAAALREVTFLPELETSAFMVTPRSLLRGHLRSRLGDSTAARVDFDSARALLEPAVRASPDDPRLRTGLAWAYTGLGRNADAIREARRAVSLNPESRDAYLGPYYTETLASTYAGAGDHAAAFGLLRHLITVPNGVSAVDLRFNENWDPLRSDPRFASLLASAEAERRSARWGR
jgi:TolB-like protein/Flp pilus assembly protein TadD